MSALQGGLAAVQQGEYASLMHAIEQPESLQPETKLVRHTARLQPFTALHDNEKPTGGGGNDAEARMHGDRETCRCLYTFDS